MRLSLPQPKQVAAPALFNQLPGSFQDTVLNSGTLPSWKKKKKDKNPGLLAVMSLSEIPAQRKVK